MLTRLSILICLAASHAQVSAQATNPFYVRAGMSLPMGDFKNFLGGRSVLSMPTLEVGYTFMVNESFSYSASIGYFNAQGKAIATYAGLKQKVNGYRLGIDARYQTPLPQLHAFAGLMLSFHHGSRVSAGTVPDMGGSGERYVVPVGPIGDSRGKVGLRFGLEYALNDHWGLTMDYSFSQWYSQGWDKGAPSGTYVIDGVNPVNPSMTTFAVQYRF